jgi:hypothetical protein
VVLCILRDLRIFQPEQLHDRLVPALRRPRQWRPAVVLPESAATLSCSTSNLTTASFPPPAAHDSGVRPSSGLPVSSMLYTFSGTMAGSCNSLPITVNHCEGFFMDVVSCPLNWLSSPWSQLRMTFVEAPEANSCQGHRPHHRLQGSER